MKEEGKFVAPICVAIIASVIAIQTSRRSADTREENAPPRSPPCSEAQKAALNGLQIGDKIGDFEVKNFGCKEPDVIDIELLRGDLPLVLTVARPGAMPHEPPKRTASYDLFYNNRRGPDHQENPPAAEVEVLLEKLADRIETKR